MGDRASLPLLVVDIGFCSAVRAVPAQEIDVKRPTVAADSPYVSEECDTWVSGTSAL
jgi:hypothetical protein